jgi:hypothetical protein
MAVLWLAASCSSNKKDKEQAPEATTKKAQTKTKTATETATPKAPEKTDPAQQPQTEASKPPPPLAHQPSHKMSRVEFLGWTAGGAMYALLATHGRDLGEYGGRSLMQLRQVHDALTGKLVDCFRVKKQTPPSKLLARVWAQAKPEERWQDFLKARPLSHEKPSARSPDGRWQIQGKQVSGKRKLTVDSVTVKAPCKLASKRGIRIGSPEAAARGAYDKDQDPDSEKCADTFVAGSIYGGLVFSFKKGKVSEMFLGASAE